MRVLYIPYATWKAVAQANSFTVYSTSVETDTEKAWVGGFDLVYATDIEPSDYSDYDAAFTTRTAVASEDEAIANIVGLGGALQPRSADGTLQTTKQQLRLGRVAFQRVDDASENMAINGTSTTSTIIWNGTGGSDTGGDWTLEVQGTETAGSAHSGTNGLDSGVRSAGQDTRLDGGSDTDIAGTYNSVSFWMQPKAFPAGSRLDIKWKTSGGGTPGSKLDVGNYITNYDLDVWQQVTIPIADFALGADVAQLELTYAAKGGQQFWFDDFELNAGGSGLGPKGFRVQSPTGVVWHVEALTIVVAAGDTGWDSDAFANIAGGLPNGLLLQHKNIGLTPQTFWSLNAKNNTEMFGQYEVLNDVNFDGTDLMIVFALKPKLSSVILVDDDDVLEFQVRDDLSTLSKVRAFLHYGEEIIP